MDQRENTRKLTNTPLPKSGVQGDASPSAPSVGERLRQETKSRASWKNFKTIEDWKKEFDSHPEWTGRSTAAMRKNKESGAQAFYFAFRKFCKAESRGDNAAYQKLFNSIFQKKQRNWSAFTTIGDWKNEFDKHPEWANKSTKAMLKDKESGAQAFCNAFRKFCSVESKGDIAAYQKLSEAIFPRMRRDWSALTTIGDWKNEFDSHPEWAGRSTKAMENDKESGAGAFCYVFRKFCKVESEGDNAAYKKLFESIFPKKHRDWSAFDTIEDWKREFAKHPDWRGRSVQEMKDDSRSGASAFQTGFSRYCREIAAGNHALLSHLKGQIFPLLQISASVVSFGHKSLADTEGRGHGEAATKIDKVSKSLGDTYKLKLPSGKTITAYSVQMISGPIWACTKKEWKTFLTEYGLKEKGKQEDARSNASLIDLL